MVCKFGCGLSAVHKGMCAKSCNSCPVNKKKNSDAIKKIWKEGRVSTYASYPKETKDKMAWARGLTKETDVRIKLQAQKLQRSRLTDIVLAQKALYRRNCEFVLTGVIDKVLGYELLVKKGMYHKKSNVEGVVRDHRFSVAKGFELGIDSSYLSHPANCRFITCRDNAKKSRSSEISFEELQEQIKKWDDGEW